MEQLYMNAAEAARYLGLSESYLAKLRMGILSDPGPDFFKVGLRAIRYSREDLDVWMASKLTKCRSNSLGSSIA